MHDLHMVFAQSQVMSACSLPIQPQNNELTHVLQKAVQGGMTIQHLPPASYAADSYTLLKLYSVSSVLVGALLRHKAADEVDFPFRCSPAEQRIVELVPEPPASLLVVGRSGTGKTTVLLYR